MGRIYVIHFEKDIANQFRCLQYMFYITELVPSPGIEPGIEPGKEPFGPL